METAVSKPQAAFVLPKTLVWLKYSLAIYLVATWCSIAAMEIFGCLSVLLVLIFAIGQPHHAQLREVFSFVPWKTLLILLGLTIVGIFVNGLPDADRLEIICSQRWIFIFMALSAALIFYPPTPRGYRLFLWFTLIVAAYSILQSFTGFDILRPGSERAVQPLDVKSDTKLWRSAGLFGSPMAYMYIVGQHTCFIMAFVLIFAKDKVQQKIWRVSVVAALVTSISLLTTYVRGGWISLFICYFVMTLMVSRKWAGIITGASIATFATLMIGIENFRLRVFSLFDPNYTSNAERWTLWQINWQMFLDYPLLGIGWGENESRAREYLIAAGLPKAFGGHAHNNFIQVLSGMGIFGFVAFVFLVGYMFKLNVQLIRMIPPSEKWHQVLAVGCLGAQTHVFIGGMTECNFKAVATNHSLMVAWGLVVALTVVYKSRSHTTGLKPQQS